MGAAPQQEPEINKLFRLARKHQAPLCLPSRNVEQSTVFQYFRLQYIPELAALPKEDQFRILVVASKKARWRWESWSLLLITFAVPLVLMSLTTVFLLAAQSNPATEDTDAFVGLFLMGAALVIMSGAAIAYVIVNKRLVKFYVRQVRQTDYWEPTPLDAYPRFKSIIVAWRNWVHPDLGALPQRQRLRAVYLARVTAFSDWRFWVFFAFVIFLSLGMMMFGMFSALVLAMGIGAGGQQPQTTADDLSQILVLIFLCGGIIAAGVVAMPVVFCLARLVWRPYMRQAAAQANAELAAK